MEHILVTGGAGFIGSHITERLLKAGYRVIILDNLSSQNYPKRYKEENLAKLSHPKLTFVLGDVTSRTQLADLFDTHLIDRIIHLAALPGVQRSLTHPHRYFLTNAIGTAHVAAMAGRYSVKHMIFASSSSVYGNSQLPFEEETPTDTPISPYGASKKSAEVILRTFHELYHIPTIALRLFSVYGPRGRPDMAPYLFLRAILNKKPFTLNGNGILARDWTYIDDIVDGFMSALHLDRGFAIVNLGDSNPVSLRDIVSCLERVTGLKSHARLSPNIPQGDMRATHASIDKAKRLLGWQPNVELEEGLKRFYEWYRTERMEKANE